MDSTNQQQQQQQQQQSSSSSSSTEQNPIQPRPEEEEEEEKKKKKKRIRFKGKSGSNPSSSSSRVPNQTNLPVPRSIPAELRNNELLNRSISELLPKNYNFEILKTLNQINSFRVKRLALQLPEGLIQFSLTISDLLKKFSNDGLCEDVIVMGDVTYGACCVDDYTARKLGCQMMVHYGHSCLIPIDQTSIRTLYVFVEIGIDRVHLSRSIRLNFPNCIPNFSERIEKDPRPIDDNSDETEDDEDSILDLRLAIVGTVQFISAVQTLKSDLEDVDPEFEEERNEDRRELLMIASSESKDLDKDENFLDDQASENQKKNKRRRRRRVRFRVTIPQIKPLSPGEILGCTAPKLSNDTDAILYIGDGRFHLESIMISNPTIPSFRYDPYSKKLTLEEYDHERMRKFRSRSIEVATKSLRISKAERRIFGDVDDKCEVFREEDEIGRDLGDGGDGERNDWGIVLGTLGRQGSLRVLKSLTDGFNSSKRRDPENTQKVDDDRTMIPILISELSPIKLSLFKNFIRVFVQTSCPRLSIDWGETFFKNLKFENRRKFKNKKIVSNSNSNSDGDEVKKKVRDDDDDDGFIPILNPYEAKISFGQVEKFDEKVNDPRGGILGKDYPMDFYADESLGDWTPRFKPKK